MLYQIYETQRSLMEPFADLAQATAKIYNNPLSPFGQTPLAQRISAGYALIHRLGKDYEKPEFGIRKVPVDGVEVAIHERVEIDKPFCELRRFKRFSDDTATLAKLKNQPSVLIVAPLSGHYATLLRDTVKSMLKDHKVYITDWKSARIVPLSEGEFHLDDYVNYVQEFIRHVQSQSPVGNCHVMSVCQPTVPVLAAVSLMASRGELTPLSMTMMGGPIDARKSPTAVNNLAMNKSFSWFENNVIYRVPGNFPGAGRRVYPGFLQHSGFVAMNPSNHARSHYDYFKDLIKGDDASAEAHRQFYDEYNAVLDMDADYYLETIQTVFQDFKLVNGTWDVRSPSGQLERVRPQDITGTALLTVEGELDDISGSGQTEAAHDLCTGIVRKEQHHMEVEGAGHYGIFSGRRWREMVYPRVKQFILAHQPVPAVAKPKAEVTPSAPAEVLAAPAPAAVPAKKPAALRKPVKAVAKPTVSAEAVTPAPVTVAPAVVAAAEVPAAAPAETPAAKAVAPVNVAVESQPAKAPVSKTPTSPAAKAQPQMPKTTMVKPVTPPRKAARGK